MVLNVYEAKITIFLLFTSLISLISLISLKAFEADRSKTADEPFSNSRRNEHDLGGRHAVGVGVALRVVAGVDVAQVVVDVVAVVVVVGVCGKQVDHVEDGQQKCQDAESTDSAWS